MQKREYALEESEWSMLTIEDWDNVKTELEKTLVNNKRWDRWQNKRKNDVCIAKKFFDANPDARYAMISCSCSQCMPYSL